MAVARLSNLDKTQVQAASEMGVTQSRIAEATTILKHAAELADAVMAGTVPLNDAYAEAKQRKEAKASREEQAKRDARDLALLRASAPDLADFVADERMSLREAIARLGVAGTEATGEPSDVTLRRRGGRWTLETRWPAVVAEPVAPEGPLREQLKA